jgi:hypothetical protein
VLERMRVLVVLVVLDSLGKWELGHLKGCSICVWFRILLERHMVILLLEPLKLVYEIIKSILDAT